MSLIEIRYSIMEQLFHIHDLALLQRIQELTSNVADDNSDANSKNESSLFLDHPYKGILDQLPPGETIEQMMEEQNVNPGSKEEWAKNADLYSVIPEDHLKESLNID